MSKPHPVLLIFSRLGKIKNCRISPSFEETETSRLQYPPSVTCWFQQEPSEIDVSALEIQIFQVRDEIEWFLEKSDKCLTLCPQFLYELSKTRQEGLRQTCQFIMESNPELAVKANLEFRELIDNLLEFYE